MSQKSQVKITRVTIEFEDGKTYEFKGHDTAIISLFNSENGVNDCMFFGTPENSIYALIGSIKAFSKPLLKLGMSKSLIDFGVDIATNTALEEGHEHHQNDVLSSVYLVD